jgi:hydrogenase maturation protease
MNTLLYGIGNSLRGDDGLGEAFLENCTLPFDKYFQFQLNIEDAELFSKYDRIIVVDAIKNIKTPFIFEKLGPQYDNSFTTHSLKPQSVLALTEKLYNKKPQLYLLGIYANQFEMNKGISPAASEGLKKALLFMNNFITQEQKGHYRN